MGRRGQAVLEDLLEAQELDDAEVDGGVEAQAALVGADGGVVLHAEAAVDLDLALESSTQGTRNMDDALGLDDALKQGGLLELRMRVE